MQEEVLLLQSKEQLRNNNNAREVADALENFMDRLLLSNPGINPDGWQEVKQAVRNSQLTRGERDKALSKLKNITNNEWALQVPGVMDTNEKLPKKRRIN